MIDDSDDDLLLPSYSVSDAPDMSGGAWVLTFGTPIGMMIPLKLEEAMEGLGRVQPRVSFFAAECEEHVALLMEDLMTLLDASGEVRVLVLTPGQGLN